MFKGGSVWTGLISGAISQLKDTQAMTSGNMDKKDFAVRTSKNITGSIGVMAGVEYGAIIGSSLLPGPGTVIGAVVGSLIGNKIGNYAVHHAGNIIFNNKIVINNDRPKLT